MRGVGRNAALQANFRPEPPHVFQHPSSVSAQRADPPSPTRGEGKSAPAVRKKRKCSDCADRRLTGLEKRGGAFPSPPVGEGAPKGRMRGVGQNAALQEGTSLCPVALRPTPLIRLGAARRSTFSHRGRRKERAQPRRSVLPAIGSKENAHAFPGMVAHFVRAGDGAVA